MHQRQTIDWFAGCSSSSSLEDQLHVCLAASLEKAHCDIPPAQAAWIVFRSLWMLGNRQLHDYLSHVACLSELHIAFSSPKIPAIISSLRALTSLTLTARTPALPLTPSALRNWIFNLPSSLTFVDFNFEGAFGCWLDCNTREMVKLKSIVPKLKVLRLSCLCRASHVLSTHYELPFESQTLYNDKSELLMDCGSFASQIFGQLPTSIISVDLEMHPLTLEMCGSASTQASLYVPHLEYLSSLRLVGVEHFVIPHSISLEKLCLPSCTYISLVNDDARSNPSSQPLLTTLLPSLTALHLPCVAHADGLREQQPQLYLPHLSQLTHISLSSFLAKTLLSVPVTKMRRGDMHPPFQHALSRKLAHLSISRAGEDWHEDFTSLALYLALVVAPVPSLTRLDLPETLYMDAGSVVLLPPTLTRLTANWHPKSEGTLMAMLPRSIKFLIRASPLYSVKWVPSHVLRYQCTFDPHAIIAPLGGYRSPTYVRDVEKSARLLLIDDYIANDDVSGLDLWWNVAHYGGDSTFSAAYTDLDALLPITNEGNHFVTLAIRNKSLSVMNWLLQKGFIIEGGMLCNRANAMTNRPSSALSWCYTMTFDGRRDSLTGCDGLFKAAVIANQIEIAQWLIHEAHLDMTIFDAQSRTATLMEAVQHAPIASRAELLALAARHESTDVFKWLVTEYGFNPHQPICKWNPFVTPTTFSCLFSSNGSILSWVAHHHPHASLQWRQCLVTFIGLLCFDGLACIDVLLPYAKLEPIHVTNTVESLRNSGILEHCRANIDASHDFQEALECAIDLYRAACLADGSRHASFVFSDFTWFVFAMMRDYLGMRIDGCSRKTGHSLLNIIFASAANAPSPPAFNPSGWHDNTSRMMAAFDHSCERWWYAHFLIWIRNAEGVCSSTWDWMNLGEDEVEIFYALYRRVLSIDGIIIDPSLKTTNDAQENQSPHLASDVDTLDQLEAFLRRKFVE